MKIWNTKSGYKIVRVLSGRSNVFLLTNDVQNILIDTSVYFMRHRLERNLKRLGIFHIDYLVLTHTHFDHADNARLIKERYNPLVVVHREEASYLASGDILIPDGTNLFTRTLVKLFAKRISSIINCKPCKYDILVDSLYDMKEFGFNAFIMHTPGHTNGSVSIVVDNEIAIVGDSMVGTFKWTIFPPFANNVKQLVNSWGKLLDTGCLLFLPSHGSANTRKLVQKNYEKRVPNL